MGLVYNTDEMEKFYQILPPISEDLVYFVSLSARNKYLTKEEREKYGLKKTEMFCRTIIRHPNFENFYQKILELENHLRVMKTNSGLYFPKHALICYINLYTSSTIRATREYIKKISDKVFNEIGCDYPDLKQFKYCDKLWLSEVQKAKYHSPLLDIDFDVSDYSVVKEFITKFNEKSKNNVKYLIETKGGWHIILRKQDIGFNFHSIVTDLNDRVGSEEEVQINKNNMVPLPGTFQGGKEVRFYEFFE